MPTIHELKEQEITDTPVILFECALPGGSTESFGTHALTHEGTDYKARVVAHSAFDLRHGSQDGIDGVAKISLVLANADSYYSQIERTSGWKGAQVTARFAFFDLKAGVATTPSTVIFRGLMNPPDEITESVIRLSAQSRLNMARYFLPDARIQRRCPWSFPTTPEQRAEAATGIERGRYSGLFRCGYSPDQPGGLGNLNGSAPYGSCDYTRPSCEQRGMFDRDGSGAITRRFGGVEFVPSSVLVRGTGERWRESGAAENQARYNDYVPLAYGTGWVEPPVVFARNDGNLTHIEVLLGHGEINGVVKVGVNDIEIPEGVSGRDMTATGWYNVVSTGGVSGGFNLQFTDGGGNPLGDPYGSMSVLSISVPNRVSEGRSIPEVRVLLEGLKVSTFDETGAPLGQAFTNNPAWVVLDLLLRSGWTLNELDTSSFARAAVFCAEGIAATDLFGNAVTIPRFQCNLMLRRRRSVAEWIRGIGAASRLYLTYGDAGLLELRPEANLAVQHGAKPASSNSTEPLGGGWPAYEFGDGGNGFSGIARRGNGESSVRLWSRDTADTANRISVEFQDEFNEYQQDSLSLVDAEDAGIVRQEISVTSPALGVANFHQAARSLALHLNRAIRGNTYVSFETSVRAAGLRPGDLVTLTYLKEGFDRQPFRITRLVPSLNHATALIEAQIHDDNWYGDDPGQGNGSRVSRRSPGAGVGTPRPLVGTALDPSGVSRLGIVEIGEVDGDGIASVTLEASFQSPTRPAVLGLEVPRLSLAASVNPTGGNLPGAQTLYYGVTAVNANGEESDLSFVVRAPIPAGANTHRVTLQQIKAGPFAVALNVYRGESPSHLLRIASAVPMASEFEDGGLSATSVGPPDGNFDHARLEWRLELQPEVAADAFSATTIGSSLLQLIADEYVGMSVRITGGNGAGQERTIATHTANLITIRGSWTVVPDGTTEFVIVESSWRLGSVATSSPGRFNVTNRPGATVHVTGVAVSAIGRHSGYETSPITRWQIGGSSGSGLDVDVPPIPMFGLQRTGQGGIELNGVSFTTLVNTRTITAGTLTVHYWDELAAAPSAALLNAVTGTATQLSLDAALSVGAGALLQVGAEVMEVDSLSGGGTVAEVLRGSFGTAALSHDAGEPVYVLTSKTHIVPFAREFFGSPASGSFGFPMFLPDVRIAAAEMFVTNTRGNSETQRLSFTGTTQQGMRTLSGGEITLQVDGPLAIQSNAAPPFVVDRAHSVGDIFAVLGSAPAGSPVTVQVRQDNEVYCTLTIPAGATVSNIVNGFGLPPLAELAKLNLDIVSVSQLATDSPGRDLTVVIRL
ncbi:MAG: phage tail protein [Bryobacteraceae bacterium]